MTSDQSPTKIDCYALVELMGHARIAGRVTEQPIGGASLIRVDVPDADGNTAYTRMYGASAIYCISPMAKDLVIKLAQQIRAIPVTEYDLPRRLPGEIGHCSVCGLIVDECTCTGDPDDPDNQDDKDGAVF